MTDEQKAEPITIDLDATLVCAALKCAADEEGRYMLQGVHVRPSPKGGVVIEATNGHILFFGHDPEGSITRPCLLQPTDCFKAFLCPQPEWRDLDDGEELIYDTEIHPPILRQVKGLRLRGELRADEGGPIAVIHKRGNPPHLKGYVSLDWMEPNYSKTSGATRKAGTGDPNVPVSFAGHYLRLISDIAQRLTGRHAPEIRITQPVDADDPDNKSAWAFTFPQNAAALVILMPVMTVGGGDYTSLPEWAGDVA